MRDSMAIDETAPPLKLPPAVSDGAVSEAGAQQIRPPLDGWNQDRVKRSSLPPSESTLLTVSRLTPLPASGEQDEGAGDALDLVQRSAPLRPEVDLASEMAERFALDDFSGALRAAELLLGRDPNDANAQHYARVSRAKLEALLFARLTSRGAIPSVSVGEDDVRWLGLGARAATLLGYVDGRRTCDQVIEACGMERLQALRAMLLLVETGAVRFLPSGP